MGNQDQESVGSRRRIGREGNCETFLDNASNDDAKQGRVAQSTAPHLPASLDTITQGCGAEDTVSLERLAREMRSAEHARNATKLRDLASDLRNVAQRMTDQLDSYTVVAVIGILNSVATREGSR